MIKRLKHAIKFSKVIFLNLTEIIFLSAVYIKGRLMNLKKSLGNMKGLVVFLLVLVPVLGETVTSYEG